MNGVRRCVGSLLLLVVAGTAEAAATAGTGSGEVKELSGISIVGNKETPKALYIVPWKDSEVGVESTLNRGAVEDALSPVDKEVFLREQEFYDFLHGKK